MFLAAHKLTDLFNQASKLILNHTRLVDESAQVQALVDEYYKLMHDEIGEKLQLDSWETYFKWPDHHNAEHRADDTHVFFELTGLPYGRGTCEVQEALNHFWKEEFKHTNGHTSVYNIDDNKFKKALRNKLLQFLKKYMTEKKRKQRPFKHCEECDEARWNVDVFGDQIPHQYSKRCAKMRLGKPSKSRSAKKGSNGIVLPEPRAHAPLQSEANKTQ